MNDEKVLLVDDNPTNLQVLFQTLEGRGYNLLIAKNGETALAIAGKAHPHLILLDIMMPEMDGYEVCRQLKADPATQVTQIGNECGRQQEVDRQSRATRHQWRHQNRGDAIASVLDHTRRHDAGDGAGE